MQNLQKRPLLVARCNARAAMLPTYSVLPLSPDPLNTFGVSVVNQLSEVLLLTEIIEIFWLLLFCFYFLSLPCHMAWDLSSQARIKPIPS